MLATDIEGYNPGKFPNRAVGSACLPLDFTGVCIYSKVGYLCVLFKHTDGCASDYTIYECGIDVKKVLLSLFLYGQITFLVLNGFRVPSTAIQDAFSCEFVFIAWRQTMMREGVRVCARMARHSLSMMPWFGSLSCVRDMLPFPGFTSFQTFLSKHSQWFFNVSVRTYSQLYLITSSWLFFF